MELESIGYELEYNIYPTPFNASLSIEIKTISSEIDTLKIQIIDQYGNEFVNQNEVITGYFPQNLSLNTSALPSGLYIVLFKYQDSTIRYQYVIKS